jgi:hypothetical protein
MSGMTNYLENELIDHIFRARAFIAPAAMYVSLHTADPGETGVTGEVSGNSYTRAQLNPSSANWKSTNGLTTATDSSGTGGVTSNASVLTWPTPTSSGWGTVTHFAIWDAVNNGNCLFYGALSVPKTINSGDAVTAAVDAVTVTLA